MAKVTEQGHQHISEALSCEANVHVMHHYIFLASLNIFLSVTASLGNVLILIALHKESFPSPANKGRIFLEYAQVFSNPTYAASLNNVFVRGCSAPRSRPLPFHILLLTKKVPLLYTSPRKWCPFHTQQERFG